MLEIARRTRLPSRPQLGAISSSRCQKTRAPQSQRAKIVASGRVITPKRFRWWSQTGSNRRPPACKAGALPTELWPRSVRNCQSKLANERVVGLGRLELPTSRLSSARSNQLSYKPESLRLEMENGRLPRAIDGIPCGIPRSRRAHPARARPRRKRNGDGGVPPMDIYDRSRSALMFPRDPIETREASLKDHP
jgi:hypothetical protein